LIVGWRATAIGAAVAAIGPDAIEFARKEESVSERH
jgi:hypothetical protein